MLQDVNNKGYPALECRCEPCVAAMLLAWRFWWRWV